MKKPAHYIINHRAFMSCKKDDDVVNQSQRTFGIFKVLDDNTTIEMDGYVRSSSLNNYNNLIAAFPNVNKINIKNCDGSDDDDINLQLSLKVHQKDIDIHLMEFDLKNWHHCFGWCRFFCSKEKTEKEQTR